MAHYLAVRIKTRKWKQQASGYVWILCRSTCVFNSVLMYSWWWIRSVLFPTLHHLLFWVVYLFVLAFCLADPLETKHLLLLECFVPVALVSLVYYWWAVRLVLIRPVHSRVPHIPIYCPARYYSTSPVALQALQFSSQLLATPEILALYAVLDMRTSDLNHEVTDEDIAKARKKLLTYPPIVVFGELQNGIRGESIESPYPCILLNQDNICWSPPNATIVTIVSVLHGIAHHKIRNPPSIIPYQLMSPGWFEIKAWGGVIVDVGGHLQFVTEEREHILIDKAWAQMIITEGIQETLNVQHFKKENGNGDPENLLGSNLGTRTLLPKCGIAWKDTVVS